MRLRVLLIGLLFFSALVAYGQEHRQIFGQNRVQYKSYDWYYYGTDDYDIHYYAQGEEYAKLALDYLDEEYDKLTDLIGYAPFSKTKIFIYNSPVDLKQSNIGVDGATFTIAGQTKFVKLQVEVAYPGSIIDFKKELKFRLTRMLLEDMMFGGSLAEMFQSAYLLHLPEWFIGGASNYMAYGWNVEMDDYMRDFFSKKKTKKLDRLEDVRAQMVGQSVWNYIAMKYGKSNMSNILNLTRIIRNPEHSIASSLGISFKQFKYEWAEYYINANAGLEAAYETPEKDNKLIGKTGKVAKLTKVRVSPDGKYLAYANNYRGKYTVNVRNLENGKERTALHGGYHVINQEVTLELPIIEWITETQLGIIQNWYGTNYLVTYDVPTRTKQRKSLVRFNQIQGIGFNDNGKLAVISADIKGQNDLYLISMRRNAVKRLTKDKYDDLNPKFIPGTDAIVFSSNRPSDTLNIALDNINEASDVLNLFAYDLDTTTTVVHRMTNTLSNDYYPVPVDRENVFYLSDQKGIYNLYKYNFSNGIYNQVSNFSASLQEYDINRQTHDLAFLMLNNGKSRIYLHENYNLNQTTFTPPTLRNQLKQVEFIRNRRAKTATDDLPQEEEEIELGEGLFDLGEAHEAKEGEGLLTQTEEEDEDVFIDTDDYQFEDDTEDEETEGGGFSFLSTYQKMQKEPSVTGPNTYETTFSSNNVITTFKIDPIRGFGILMEYEMNDVLENHKFYGGFLAITDLQSGDFFAEYRYLKNTIDLMARFDRNVYLEEHFDYFSGRGEEIIQKYKKNTFTVGASLPLSVATRFDIQPFMTFTHFYNLNPDALSGNYPATEPYALESQNTFMGIRANWVYDNTLANGLNLYEGSRAKISFEHFQGVNNNDRTFSNLTVDLRRYQKISRELIIATRVYYGRSFGKHPKTYMLGGMDNWVANDSEDNGQESSPLYFSNTKDNTDILFTEFVNLRGFDYNKFSGTNVLTFNAELRFPIVKYFSRGSIKSNFLRNFQVIGFYDLGSAWTGKSPFSDDHEVNTKVVKKDNSPFEAVIRTSNNPWLASYGFGLRTVLLGYYARFDFAKPMADYQVGDMHFYLSLGYDF
ncbi:translocation protein TolB [Reichenbachiella carrageenanivorans]|uniref:Translocation protein TolB n=1 Tax=Reichenbachiella carrageenanivorans TaxID=2979869 RepID=A0ABY6D932_9BACT|nr:translocation protein TolB [Reichenbachiella carrageenanivorans]UXX80390.1 translocation protein TolB [Reichenbachiella carrageenanivorans]